MFRDHYRFTIRAVHVEGSLEQKLLFSLLFHLENGIICNAIYSKRDAFYFTLKFKACFVQEKNIL